MPFQFEDVNPADLPRLKTKIMLNLADSDEENPMLGWREGQPILSPEYKEGFLLEVAAVRRAREQFGLTNRKVMIPICRTPRRARRCLR